MHEDVYQQGSADVALELAANHVQGVWEERFPLVFDAALTLGCVAEILPSMRSKPLSEVFGLEDLKVNHLESICLNPLLGLLNCCPGQKTSEQSDTRNCTLNCNTL